MSDNITLPRKHIDYAAHALEHFNKDAPDPLVSEIIHHLRTALAAPLSTHPGYIIGSHWLETAYSRICAGEAEADVLRDCGWERVDDAEALRRDAERLNAVALQAQNAAIDLTKKNERLRQALKLALNSHGRMLMSDPPQDAWKFYRVNEVIAAALRREDAT